MKNVADLYHLTSVQRETLNEARPRVVQTRWRFSGELNSVVFERAWEHLLARHSMLRTCFLTQLDEPVQVVRQQVRLSYQRTPSDQSKASDLTETSDHADELRGFDPAKAPLFRVVERQVGEREYEFVLEFHPVVFDEQSVRLLVDEALAVYRAFVAGAKAELSPAVSYRDYVAWVERQDLSGAERYWRNAFASSELSSLTTTPAESANAEAPASRHVTFGRAQTDALKEFVDRAGLSLETLITGAWALVLMREQNRNELSVGVVARERPRGFEQIVGLCSNALPLPLTFSGEGSTWSWLQEVEQRRSRIQRYAHVSQAQVRKWLGIDADAPLFGSVVLFREVRPDDLADTPVTNVCPLRLEAVLGDELTLHLHAECSDAERTAIRLIYSLHNTLASLAFPALYLSERSIPARVEPQTESEPNQSLEFSLFYFADDNAVYGADKYRLYREGAIFADQHELTAVWTPERHFHEKAGLYPNPSVLSASLATITKQVQLRAGSVVLPLHNSLRVAEEWSVVDNLSQGRVGISFTSGWMPNDFAFFPERYANKREEMFRGIHEVQDLWRGQAIAGRDGVGKEIELRIFPKPINPELPIWLTCSGGPEMFEKAGELGCHVLTALLTQSIEEVAPKIRLYRDSLVRHGHNATDGKVTMMMHTFVGEDADEVLRKVKAPLTKYLKSHMNLIETGAESLKLGVNISEHDDPEKYRDQMASYAFERYYRTSSLIGTPASCMKMIERLKAIGVDEVACLIDFGVEVDSVLESLEHLVVLKDLSNCSQPAALLASTAAV
jgi:natural product biosynthesis luciferase-like monooxygenase protein